MKFYQFITLGYYSINIQYQFPIKLVYKIKLLPIKSKLYKISNIESKLTELERIIKELKSFIYSFYSFLISSIYTYSYK